MPRKFQLEVTTCRRCGKPVTTGNRSIHATDEIKAKYDRICASCVTPQEVHEMNVAIGEALAATGGKWG